MNTIYYTHPAFLAHDTGLGHPESPARLRAVAAALKRPEFAGLLQREAPRAEIDRVRLVHSKRHIDRTLDAIPRQGIQYLDPDTPVSPGSGEAALRAVGAVCAAVDAVFAGEAMNAFCGVRPPGHHAEPERAMGF